MLYDEFRTTISECPFCTGAHNRMLAERPHAYLTYAYAPYHKHHLLVVPKRHTRSVEELTSEEEAEVHELEKVGLKALKKLGYADVTLLVREGPVDKNKTMEHTHYHVVPFVGIGDLDHAGQKRRIMTDAEVAETVADIARAL